VSLSWGIGIRNRSSISEGGGLNASSLGRVIGYVLGLVGGQSEVLSRKEEAGRRYPRHAPKAVLSAGGKLGGAVSGQEGCKCEEKCSL